MDGWMGDGHELRGSSIRPTAARIGPPHTRVRTISISPTQRTHAPTNPTRLLLGEAFVEVSEDYATEYCEKRQEQLQAQVEELGAEKERIASRQQVCVCVYGCGYVRRTGWWFV